MYVIHNIFNNIKLINQKPKHFMDFMPTENICDQNVYKYVTFVFNANKTTEITMST